MPPSRLLTEGDDRQAAHLRAVKALANRTRAEILEAFRGLTGPRVTEGRVNRVLALRERLEQILRRDLVALGQTSYRGWSRAWTRATGLARMRGRNEPGVVETQEIVDSPILGQLWTTRLDAHTPTMNDLLRVFSRPPGAGRTRADVIADLERLASRVAARVATLARTEANRVNQVMSDRAAADVIGDDGIAGWRYMTMDDERVRPEHKLLHGRLYGRDEERPVVPNGVNCFPGWVPVQGRFVGGLRVLYHGEVVELTTAEGRRLTVTPHHPVATVDGFVPAGAIQEGAQLVAYGRHVDRAASGEREDDEDHEPLPIEEVFRALADVSPRLRVRPSAEDLHGDAQGTNGEVEVVGPFRGLRSHGVGSGQANEQALHPELVDSGVAAPGLARPRAEFALGNGLHAASRRSVGAGDLRGDAGGVELDLRPLQELGVGAAADLDLTLLEPDEEGRAADAQLVAELLQRLPGDVATDHVVNVERRAWSGHVYDLQGIGGWIVAAGLLLRNCRCFYVPFMSPGAMVRLRGARQAR